MCYAVGGTDLVRVRSGGEDYFATIQTIVNAVPVLGLPAPTQAPVYPPVNAQTGTTYTFVLGDNGQLVTLSNASAVTATVPPNSSVAFPIGSTIPILQLGAGLVTVAAGAGVTISTVLGSLALAGQYARATLTQVDTDSWLLNGDLASGS